MVTTQARFEDVLQAYNLIKCLQEFKSFIEFHGIYNMHRSYVKLSFLNTGSF